MDKSQGYLGLARRAGLLVVGEEGCSSALSGGKARLLLLASDTAENTVGRAGRMLSGHRAPLQKLPWTKDELSALLGKRGCAMLCFTDLTFAAQFAASMAETLPEWKETSALLEARKEKARRRRAGPRKHAPAGKKRD